MLHCSKQTNFVTALLVTASIIIGTLFLFPTAAISLTSKPSPIVEDTLLSTLIGTNTLTLTATKTILATHDGEAVVTATVQDIDGQPVAGKIIQFNAVLGTVSSTSVTTDQAGQAKVTFRADSIPGMAKVIVTADSLSENLALTLETPQVDTLDLQTGTDRLLINQSLIITVVVRDQFGRPAAGELVSLFGSMGIISQSSGLTNKDGEVVATFQAGTRGGQARISALAGYDSQTSEIWIVGPVNVGDYFIYLPIIIR